MIFIIKIIYFDSGIESDTMILRAKTATLFQGKRLTEKQQANSMKNIQEMEAGAEILKSYPRRLVFELTNACNLKCVMCGRNAAEFKPTMFNMDWFRYFDSLLDTVEEVTLMGWGEPTTHPKFEKMLDIIGQHDARIYFCTNGMRLNHLQDAIFRNQVDVFAVSVDGARPETNDRIRQGSSLEKICASLREIEREKMASHLDYPYINFVFCAMRSNFRELPDLVRLAAEIGIDEVKVVYLTAFDERLAEETLWGCAEQVQEVFDEAVELGNQLGISLKLPYLQGEDPAGDKLHRDCFVAWRDFFLGSDGFVRPCMSTPRKFFAFDTSKDFFLMWNAPEFRIYRTKLNHPDMDEPCRRCYQSSHCNWNRKKSFLQIGDQFSPEWKR